MANKMAKFFPSLYGDGHGLVEPVKLVSKQHRGESGVLNRFVLHHRETMASSRIALAQLLATAPPEKQFHEEPFSLKNLDYLPVEYDCFDLATKIWNEDVAKVRKLWRSTEIINHFAKVLRISLVYDEATDFNPLLSGCTGGEMEKGDASTNSGGACTVHS